MKNDYARASLVEFPGQTPWMSSTLWYGGLLVGVGVGGAKSGSSRID
ncbi:MAG TPA: hypothetical protein PLI95_17890 [Polyangiaceae bacterium]|nr:hypothetical protein [Polyangiaceae bacterium]